MEPDFDTFLVAVYTEIDTLLSSAQPPVRPGPPPRMSDTAVLTLVVIGHWGGSSERGLLRWAETYLRSSFPVILSQSAFNRRVRQLGPRCVHLLLALAEVLGVATSPYQVVDTTAVPLARRCRGARQRLFADEAAVGHGGVDRQFSYGSKLLLAVAADGPISGVVLGPADTQDRWLGDALLTWRMTPDGIPWTVADIPRRSRRGHGRVGPTGPRWWPDSVGAPGLGLYLADRGFGGDAWRDHWAADTAAWVLTDQHPVSTAATRHSHHHGRQVIEPVNGLLAGVFHLAYPRAKTMGGVVTRVAATCTAFNRGVWGNRLFGRPDLAVGTLLAG